MKLDPSNTLVAAVQGNAWLLLLPAGFLCVCPSSSCRGGGPTRTGLGTDCASLSTNVTASSQPSLLPTAEPGEAVLPGSQNKLGARTLRSARHFLCWLWLVRPGQWAALLTPAESNRHVPDSTAH